MEFETLRANKGHGLVRATLRSRQEGNPWRLRRVTFHYVFVMNQSKIWSKSLKASEGNCISLWFSLSKSLMSSEGNFSLYVLYQLNIKHDQIPDHIFDWFITKNIIKSYPPNSSGIFIMKVIMKYSYLLMLSGILIIFLIDSLQKT